MKTCSSDVLVLEGSCTDKLPFALNRIKEVRADSRRCITDACREGKPKQRVVLEEVEDVV